MQKRVINITGGVKEEVLSGCGLKEQTGVTSCPREVDVMSTVGSEDQMQRAGPRPAIAGNVAGEDEAGEGLA